MATTINRDVPKYPGISPAGITPAGFGSKDGDKPCFCTEYNYCKVYLPNVLVSDAAIAEDVFKQIVPELNDMWPNCRNKTATVSVGKETWKVLLDFAFSHILVRRIS
jgi:hypothetical protein